LHGPAGCVGLECFPLPMVVTARPGEMKLKEEEVGEKKEKKTPRKTKTPKKKKTTPKKKKKKKKKKSEEDKWATVRERRP
jgi:hypothetical protein